MKRPRCPGAVSGRQPVFTSPSAFRPAFCRAGASRPRRHPARSARLWRGLPSGLPAASPCGPGLHRRSSRATHHPNAAAVALALTLAALSPALAPAAWAGPAALARAGDAFVLQADGGRAWTIGNQHVSFRVGLSSTGALVTQGLARTGSRGEWKMGTAADFTFVAGGRRLTPGQAGFAFVEARVSSADALVELELVFADSASGLRVTRHYTCVQESAAIEAWSVFEAGASGDGLTLGDIGIWRLAVPVTSIDWVNGLQATDEEGGRFTIRHRALEAGGEFAIGSSGRASERFVPVAWFQGAHGTFFGGLRWSGAWKLSVTGPAASGLATIHLTLGDTETTVRRGTAVEGPHGFFGVTGPASADVTRALQAYIRQGVRRGRLFEAPVTYNTWFAYGTRIDERVVRREMEKAARMGVELFTVDAGWYAGGGGVWDFSSGLGDWRADPERFPSGLRALSDRAHELGMKFGLWIEPERVDLATVDAEGLAGERMLATAGGRFDPSAANGEAQTAQICLGDAEARAWVLEALVRLIDEARPDYLKWDNNFWINCDRASHGHGAKDGNFAHVKGLYAILGELRRRYPALVIENCSGGGNRLDLGILEFTDSAWMDDVTAPSAHVRHNLQGLGRIFPPAYLLSFVIDAEAESIHDPGSRSLGFRSRMTGMLGLTLRSSDLGDEELAEMGKEIAAAKEVRAAVPVAAELLLTDQARADGASDLDAVELLSMTTGAAAVFAYAQAGVDAYRVRLAGLDAGLRYRLSTLAGQPLGEATGADLMDAGVEIVNTSDSGSSILLVTPAGPAQAVGAAVRR